MEINHEQQIKILSDEGEVPPGCSKGLPSSEQSPCSPTPNGIKEWLFVFVVASGQLLAQAGFAQALVPASSIGASFSVTSVPQLSWFSASYTLTTGTFILASGRLGDMYGHKRLFIFGYVWFGLWSLLCGLAYYVRSAIFFDICRAVQGIGPAILIPNGLAILGLAYPAGPRKDHAFALFGAAAPIGFLMGALFSALLAQKAFWAWSFWVAAIVSVGFSCAAKYLIPNLSKAGFSRRSQRMQKFDYAGSFTGASGLILLNISWNQAPAVGWKEPYVITFLVLGVGLIGVFFYVELRAPAPLIPVKSLSKEALFVLIIMALGWSSFGIGIFYYFQFVETLRHSTSLSLVAQITPATISGPIAAVTTGFLMSKVPVPSILVPALMAFCAGNIILATMPASQSYWKQAFWAQVIMPWGMDMSFPVSTVILSNMVPSDQQGIAASLVATVINYSISIGLGIAGTVKSQLSHNDIVEELRGAFYVGIGLSGCGVFLALYYAFTEYRLSDKEKEQDITKEKFCLRPCSDKS